MGEGIKISEEHRPSILSISKKLDSKISKQLQSFFIIDLQNDCNCSIENYDAEIDCTIAYLSTSGVKYYNSSHCLALPMLSEICDQDILNLLQEAGTTSSGVSNIDCLPTNMLFNIENDSDQVWSIYKKYTKQYVPSINRAFINGVFGADFVPKNQIWFMPQPEFFGCISVNIDKFGVFCLPQQIFKIGI